MERRPDASYTGLRARDRLVCLLQLLSTGVPQQLDLLQNLIWRHVPHANRLGLAVDVVAGDHGVAAGSGGDGEFDLGIGFGEFGEEGLDEATANC